MGSLFGVAATLFALSALVGAAVVALEVGARRLPKVARALARWDARLVRVREACARCFRDQVGWRRLFYATLRRLTHALVSLLRGLERALDRKLRTLAPLPDRAPHKGRLAQRFSREELSRPSVTPPRH